MLELREDVSSEAFADDAYFSEGDVRAPSISHDKEPRPIVQPGFQLPRSVWVGMIACYVVFFSAMAVMVGAGDMARFMLVISVLYTCMFFGAGTLLARLPGLPDLSPLDRGLPLETWCGPMDRAAVFGQVLVVPGAIATFGVLVAAISLIV